MLTPSLYWRVAVSIERLQSAPPQEYELPLRLSEQAAPPRVGDGVLLADYDAPSQTGIVRYIGIIRSRSTRYVSVDWFATSTEIWVDTAAGRGNWAQKTGFKFAPKKVAGYGLHQLFADSIPDLEPRETLPHGARAIRPVIAVSPQRSAIPRERLDPVEVVGEATDAARGGYVYVLRSAYGYKVGRARNIPNRMRAFGVKLPIMYSISLCAWFDDYVEAETAYHRRFADKRINGEWFELAEEDVAMIRSQQY